MSTYRLERLFAPANVAVVGASSRQGSLGHAVLKNLNEGGFKGAILPVNPKYDEIDGVRCARSIEQLADMPDLVVVCTPPAPVPGIIAVAGSKGAAGAIVIAAGLGRGPGSLAEAVRAEARKHGLRLIGPNCLGVLFPRVGLNASFTARGAMPGSLALISQSGAVAAGLVEWAAERRIGWSGMVSLGDQLDVDVADCLDYFALDPSTRSILLYIEAIRDARKFMSAARAAARVKPVVVIKSGRHEQGARAAATHTGALAGSDAVFDAAFRRAGVVRVFDFDELFAAAETLGRQRPFAGNCVALLTNGGGVGVLAVDRLIDLGGAVAPLSEQVLASLDAVLPATWSRANPVDIIGDADGARYAVALEALLDDDGNDAAVVLNVPTALASASAAAEAVVEVVRRHRARRPTPKPVFAAWIGNDGSGGKAFAQAGVPHFATETEAVRGLMHLVRYREAQDDLTRTPESLPRDFAPDAALARGIVANALAQGRAWLDPLEAGDLLAAYAIPATPSALARTVEEVAACARSHLAEGGTVAVKILSPDIVHKSDVGGVALNLASEGAARDAAQAILDRVRRLKPQARVTGLIVQPMMRRPNARELIVGIADDPTFGPVVAFGTGGTAVEVIDDKALALPPLDLEMARDLVSRTRASRLLKAHRNVPAVNEEQLALVLVKVAQLVADLPEVRELDLNPLLADASGIVAVDARVAIAAVPASARSGSGHPRFAVRPYPSGWERTLTLPSGRKMLVRPIRPDDERLYPAFLARVTADDFRLRFFSAAKELTHAEIARLTQLDYARAIAFVALEDQSGDLMGVARLHADANRDRAEYAILVRSDLKGQGLGWALMQLLFEWARGEGVRVIEGKVLATNTTMLAMCRELGFAVRSDPKDFALQIVTYEPGMAPSATSTEKVPKPASPR